MYIQNLLPKRVFPIPIIFLLILVNTLSKGQIPVFTQINEYVSVCKIQLIKNETVILNNPNPFSSLSYENHCLDAVNITTTFDGYRQQQYVTNFYQPYNPESEPNILIFPKNQNSIQLLADQTVWVTIKCIHVPTFNGSINYKLNKTSDRCAKPTMLSYTVWRQGLPNPKPPREATVVQHLVVHHAAGSNTDTNYINTVRNIYLLHTQSNGWDDIGYNYLIAPNGMVFMGRDPQGVADEDNILGAHFCAKNQNTMGVCILGDYMLRRPTKAAVFSLQYLLAWKLKKEQLNPYGQSIHPINTGSLLKNICGHRDGCNTDCPGDSLYAILPSIIKESARIADSCGLGLNGIHDFFNIESVIYPNPFIDHFSLNLPQNQFPAIVKIYNSMGQLVTEHKFNNGNRFEINLTKGLYYCTIQSANQSIYTTQLISK
jgi:hypothetical protein